MNPAVAQKGSSFKGAIAYITHDVQRNSDDRVAETGTFNMRTNDPEKAVRVMAWTAEHAGDLKAAAGLPTTGRKTIDPVYHFALTWEPSQQPDMAEMKAAAGSALETLGFAGHEAVYAVHTDKAHTHIHVVVNRINPETGHTVNPDKDYDRLQRWAWEYEKAHGHIYCIDRALRFERDPELRAELLRQQAIEHERGNQTSNKSRPAWQAEQDAPYPKSRTAREVRADLTPKAKALTTQSRDMAGRHGNERVALWQAYESQKRTLWDQQRSAYRAEAATALKHGLADLKGQHQAARDELRATHQQERSAILNQYRDAERQTIDRLFASQRQEFRAFLETSHRQGWMGALATAVQAARHSRPDGERPNMRADIARFMAAALSTDKRATLFLAGQKAERDKLRAILRRAHAPKRKHDLATLNERQRQERSALTRLHGDQRQKLHADIRQAARENGRQKHAEARHHLRSTYVADRAQLTRRQQQERAQLKQAWATHNAERHQAWTRYRAHRQDKARAPLTPPFTNANRRADTRAREPQRHADTGRSHAPSRRNEPSRGLQ